jgi:hypothetical protein
MRCPQASVPKADPKLAVIMDKCIRYLSADEMTSIITNNSSPLVHSWTEILNQLPGRTFILLVVAILLAIALAWPI